jgi:hypothetical protein
VQLTNSARRPVKSYVVSVMEQLSRPDRDHGNRTALTKG